MTNAEKARKWRAKNRDHTRSYMKSYMQQYRAKKKAEQLELQKIESTKQLERGLDKYVETYEDLASAPKAKRP